MIKLYFKKLLFTMGFLINYFLSVFIIGYAWHLIFRDMFSELVNTFIIAILALALDFGIICIMRYKNLYHKTDVIKILSFWRNFINIFKSRDNIVHTLAFISILLPFCVFITVVEKTPLLPLVVGTIILLFACGLIFLIVNALIWSIVHQWRKKGTK